ncbi:MAG: Fe-S cluster-containing oxidoreductase [Candidatus Alkanophagales archaeon MCA70_species_2]|nr:Fe-S cluster-containing oxidoreductase [Candidatus Alkanophaga liquidiphilum]
MPPKFYYHAKIKHEGRELSELKLQFNETWCLSCESYDCLLRCQYLSVDRETAKAEIKKIIRGEDSFVLHECVTCYACEEYCNKGNHPFYLIVERQEEKDILPAPKPIIKQWIQMAEPTRPLEIREVKEPVISLCFFPEYVSKIRGKLFKGASMLTGRHFFCNLVYLHFARSSVTKERLPKVIENITRHGIKELICLHDECYSTFTSYAPAVGIEVPFKPIHYFEYLYKKLKEREDEIKPLGMKVAYQRPCSSRLVPEKEHFVDDIFELIGVERVEREYDGENCLCCGAVFKMQGNYELAVGVQKKNVEDMVNAGAEACVFNCPYCFYTLSELVSERNIRPLHMIDICRLALGEEVK